MGIEQKIVELITKIQDGVTLHGSEAIRLVLLIVRVEAIVTLVICLAILLGVTILTRVLWVWWKKDLGYGNDEIRVAATVTGGLLGGIVTVISLGYLFQARLWMALIDPRLALTYDVMKKVLGK